MVVSAGFTGSITTGNSSTSGSPYAQTGLHCPTTTPTRAQTSIQEEPCQGVKRGASATNVPKATIAQAEYTPPDAKPSFHLIFATVKMQVLGKISRDILPPLRLARTPIPTGNGDVRLASRTSSVIRTSATE